ncbi:ubiquinone-dependent pyruvate dehydrogenase [Streptomyces sp. Vc74B-19]|uniref:ubiquinone-dependent pyruvate dehydrogenase n=1 Tax=Streptomyces sp. Vc74B-19 TaxID=2741324 RepID=UPI001BFC9EE3|nr:ubiquinone-dependent pyruvate dehydrogenase [Streptomyces sp. Vc74B-19]MBT3166377.1 ubiquinone-dependent pyruvate dehydrogenase [Streptomyces sp. Vc74B-19]
MSTTVADRMVEALAASGVRRVHGLPGDSLNGFTDALRRNGTVGWTHVRHEETAAFAAAGEASLTGHLAVAAGSCGPGNLHLINGLYEAQRSRVPVLAIAAHIPSEEIGSEYFQETHPQDVFRECSVYCELASTPEQVPRLLHIAMRMAVERGGVSVLVVPGDMLLAALGDAGTFARPVLRTASHVTPDRDALAEAAGVLNDAKRVTILGGAGCQGAHAEVMALADALRSPVVHSLRGKEHLEYDNPYDVGLTGLIGYSSGYRAMEHCDTLLMLGTDFPYRPFYPPPDVPVVQVDIRGEHIGRRTGVTVPLVGTVKDTAAALLPLLRPKTDGAFAEKLTKHYRRVRSHLDRLGEARPTDAPMHPQHVAAAVDRLAADDTVFTADVGTPTVWAARYLTMNGRRRLIGSFNHGSMANALPQAIGAQAAAGRRRQVVALCGDGGLSMLLGDLITLRHLRLPVKVVVFNNGTLSFVELEMKAGGIVNYGTDLDDLDFAAVARSAGIFGVRVDRAGQLDDALSEALALDGPAVVDARTASQELSLPPNLTYDQVKGFSLFATRTVLSGQGDELLELAKTNLHELPLLR